MIYPSDFEQKIGFTPLRGLLSDKCLSELGKRHVGAMSFKTDYETVSHELQCVDEMVRLLRADVELPLGGMHDVTPYLKEIRAAGSFMSAQRLYKLSELLRELERIHGFFERNAESCRHLSLEFAGIVTFPEIVAAIGRVVNKYGEVKDDASPALYELRREMSRLQSSMQSLMRRVIDRAASQGIVEKDTAPSVRDGRLVIPVSAASKRALQGIVHDESATGKTVYIEPMEVVQAANRMRELELEEQREIAVILTGVAGELRPHIDDIIAAADVVGLFDFIYAKAQLAIQTDAQLPALERKPELDWYHAVHPVLKLTLEGQGREVVPLDIALNGKRRILVISGPNAGGKSVCLKTVGVNQYMLQCGLLPCLYSNSHAAVFRNLLIDIGDEQSIENDLSTYSSHLRNMRQFLKSADGRTLILADEMGSGTEPQIGGALAQAILKALNGKRCFGVITTHYQNLKTFAESEPGLVNGAMIYDREHLRPLFRLAVGSPGSSFALEIARKTGLSREIIDDAKEIVGSDYVNLDKYMLDIARDRRYWQDKRQQIREKERRLDNILDQYESKVGDIRQQRAALIHEAREEAREIMQGANAKLERAIRDIREAQAEKERTKQIRSDLERYKRELQEEEQQSKSARSLRKLEEPLKKSRRMREKEAQRKAAAEEPKKRDFAVGDYVRLSQQGVAGKVLSISGKRAEVAFGALRTFVELDKLTAASKPKEKPLETTLSVSSQTSEESRRRQLNFKQEIDVRGMRADEALQAVTYFIDDAVQFGASRVRILHGTGHGILRTLIRQYLGSHTAVASYADEDVRFGGAGITVVNLE